jgi:cytochrome c-type biogenesis protein CcmH
MLFRRRGPCGRAALLLALALGLASAPLVAGETAAADTWGYDLSHDLMSPFCPGRTLATCPSPQAAELVQWIVMQEAAGASREQVIDMLVERYGEEILGAPPAEGITLWAYVFPIAGFVLGGGLVFLALRRLVRAPRAGSSPGSRPPRAAAADVGTASEDELARLVDAEVARRS